MTRVSSKFREWWCHSILSMFSRSEEKDDGNPNFPYPDYLAIVIRDQVKIASEMSAEYGRRQKESSDDWCLLNRAIEEFRVPGAKPVGPSNPKFYCWNPPRLWPSVSNVLWEEAKEVLAKGCYEVEHDTDIVKPTGPPNREVDGAFNELFGRHWRSHDRDKKCKMDR